MQRTAAPEGWSTLESVQAADEEVMVKVCGVAMTMLPGQSWVPTWSIDSS